MLLGGVSFRNTLLILLFVWTFVFFLFSGLINTPYLFESILPPASSCGTRDVAPKSHFPKELSFILLNWKRLDCLKTIVQNAQRYHTFITEIVIGNNNPNITLKPQDFASPLIPVKVLNFPQNRYFYARYEACMFSEGEYCYMQDDDWENKHLRSLYANFLRYPHLLHTDTNAYVHYLSWAWTFFDDTINLHTGFSWVGTGAIASKKNVKRFIQEQGFLMSREDLPLADMYFSSWFNQVPYQLENELTELESRFGFSSETGGIKRNKIHITRGVRLLHEEMEKNSTEYFTKEEEHPTVEERYTKSPCFNDDCLLMTSLHSFPNPRQLIYSADQDLDNVEQKHFSLFDHTFFVSNAYHHAVDDNMETSWISLKDINPDDYFGLDMLQPVEREYVFLKVGHGFQSELSIDVSYDGKKWDNKTCDWEFSTKAVGTALYHRYFVTSGCFCSFRFVRFRALVPYPSAVQVFDLSVTDRTGMWASGADGIVVKPQGDDGCIRKPEPTLPLPITKPKIFLREIGNGELPVTFVLLNWRRTHNFPFIFAHIANYTFINEYIIWNNNKEMVLVQSELFPVGTPPGVTVRIVNSPQNLHDYAKYLSCSMAKNDYCYFQDDDWQNVYLRSQYTNFLRFPHLFHSMTIPIIYLEHRRWNIYDAGLGMHTGFSWLGVGSFTSKKRVQAFLNQLSLFGFNQDQLLQADIFFAYFGNDYPIELATKASALDQSNAWSTSVDQWGIVYQRLTISSSKVYDYLKSGNKDNIFSIHQLNPPYEARDVRAPCRNDNCLFVTNSYPFPYPDKVPFSPGRTIKEQEAVYNNLDWPSNWFWLENSYERAVDADPFTAWSSYQVAAAGDYFGIDTLLYKVHQKFTIVLDHDITPYEVSISSDGVSWLAVPYTIEQALMLAGPLRTYTIMLPKEKPFRFLNFFLPKADNQIMSVYEICEGDFPGRMFSVSENKIANPSFEEGINAFVLEPVPRKWYVQYPEQVDFVGLQRGNVVASTGMRSLIFSSKGGASLYEASQVIELNQDTPRTVILSALSKAENVINMEYPGSGYSIVIDLSFEDGTTEYDSYTSVFNPGSHAWQAKVIAITVDRPIYALTMHLLFRNHKGTVYFDDISLQEEL